MTIRTDLGNTRESARRIRVERAGHITKTDVQRALEIALTLPLNLASSEVTNVLPTAHGGTGTDTPTPHALQLGAGANALTQLLMGAGTVLAGAAGADPLPTATPTLGVAGNTKGTLTLAGNTSGSGTLQPQAAAGSSVNWTLPALTGLIALANAASSTAVTGNTKTYAAADVTGAIVKRSNSGTHMIDTLPGTGGAGVLAANTLLTIKNEDTTAVLMFKVGSGANLDGVSTTTIYVGPGQSVTFYSDGSNYLSLGKPPRCKLAGNISLFVSSAGLDTNSGLTAADAWLTGTNAWNVLRDKFDLAGFTITVNIAAGTYTQFLAIGPLTGQSSRTACIFVGSIAGPTSYIFSNTTGIPVGVASGAKLWIRGIRMTGTTSHNCVVTDVGSELSIDKVDFAGTGAASSDFYLTNYGYVSVDGGYTFSSAAATDSHMTVAGFGYLQAQGVNTYTFLNGSPYNYAGSGFVRFDFLGFVNHRNATWDTSSGATVTGKRYAGNGNSVCHGAGVGANYFPGNAAGTVGGGAYYDA